MHSRMWRVRYRVYCDSFSSVQQSEELQLCFSAARRAVALRGVCKVAGTAQVGVGGNRHLVRFVSDLDNPQNLLVNPSQTALSHVILRLEGALACLSLQTQFLDQVQTSDHRDPEHRPWTRKCACRHKKEPAKNTKTDLQRGLGSLRDWAYVYKFGLKPPGILTAVLAQTDTDTADRHRHRQEQTQTQRK